MTSRPQSPDLTELIRSELPFAPNSQQEALIGALGRYLTDGHPAIPTGAVAKVGEQIRDVYMLPPQEGAERIFVLNGYAGTGKTSVMGAVVRALTSLAVPTVLLAPTGRAAKVLETNAGHPAYTIHRRIYRGDTVGSGAPLLLENVLQGAVFIVDEASMIGADDSSGGLLQDLLMYVFSGVSCRLILMGDTAQLPPVGSPTSPAMDPEVLRSMGFKVSHVTITAPARQKARSGLLYNATRERMALTAPTPQIPEIFASRFDDVRVFSDPEDFTSAYTSDYRTESSPLDTIIITRSNRDANEINRAVRSRILDLEEELTPGERLMVVKNNYLWCEKVPGIEFIANGDVVVVDRINGIENRYGLRFADVALTLPDYGLSLEAKLMLDTLASLSAGLDYDYEQTFMRHLSADPGIASLAADPARQMRLLRKNPYFNALRVKYGYCITCHKAQGGQWRNVYVHAGYLPPEADLTELTRWLYTATTRATGRLNFISPPFPVR